jgi:hypothetical protein
LKDLEDQILELAVQHLSRISEYDPYQNFPGVNNRATFSRMIARDPAFRHLGLDESERYVIARIGGNLITSLHRKVGDMYEDIFQILIRNRFDLNQSDLSYSVDLPIGGRTQERSTDGYVPIEKLVDKQVALTALVPDADTRWPSPKGIAFEVRSCYQIGDSKRIQADYDMALALAQKQVVPVMLIMCETSLRSPVTRLRASWALYEGENTFDFIKTLTEFDLVAFMNKHSDKLKKPIQDALSSL